MKKLAALFSDVIKEQDSQDGVPDWARSQRDKNVWGLLAVVRLFLIRGSIGTQNNQRSFWHSGLLAQVLEIAFHASIDMNIRTEVVSILHCIQSSATADLPRLFRPPRT